MRAFFKTSRFHLRFHVWWVRLGSQFISKRSGLNIQDFEGCCLLGLDVIWSGSGTWWHCLQEWRKIFTVDMVRTYYLTFFTLLPRHSTVQKQFLASRIFCAPCRLYELYFRSHVLHSVKTFIFRFIHIWSYWLFNVSSPGGRLWAVKICQDRNKFCALQKFKSAYVWIGRTESWWLIYFLLSQFFNPLAY
jgi:hypothetical protein